MAIPDGRFWRFCRCYNTSITPLSLGTVSRMKGKVERGGKVLSNSGDAVQGVFEPEDLTLTLILTVEVL